MSWLLKKLWCKHPITRVIGTFNFYTVQCLDCGRLLKGSVQ